jgi:hypothetical protein
MEEMLARVWDNLIGRTTGPMQLRLILQPLMASIFALLAGLNDARAGKPPYFWSIFVSPGYRREMLHDGWKSIGKVFIAAMALDVVYQLIVERWVYPLEVIIVALILAIVPYLIVRGLTNRIASIGGPNQPDPSAASGKQ